jgi:hypothetical protein
LRFAAREARRTSTPKAVTGATWRVTIKKIRALIERLARVLVEERD